MGPGRQRAGVSQSAAEGTGNGHYLVQCPRPFGTLQRNSDKAASAAAAAAVALAPAAAFADNEGVVLEYLGGSDKASDSLTCL